MEKNTDCSPSASVTLYKLLINSDGLFFIYYTPENKFKSCWFLVKINHDETEELEIEPRTTGNNYITFLSRHPFDNHLCGYNVRWWPLCYEYAIDKNNIHIYGARILFKRNRKPNTKGYILWKVYINLTDPSCYIH